MREKSAGLTEIPALLEQGWTLKHGNFGGQWWLERGGDSPRLRKAYGPSARALLSGGVIHCVTKDFHRGDTFALKEAGE